MTAVRWTEEQLSEFLGRRDQGKPAAATAVESLGIATTTPKARRAKVKAPAIASGVEVAAPVKKRRGVEAAPIIASLRNCQPRIKHEPGELPVLSILFEGARLFTVNEIISILQFRKHEVFRYKAAWRRLVKRALDLLPVEGRPFFEGPVRLEIVRRAAKTMDDDASRMPFKYAIDSLVRNKKRPWGVLLDDNRKVVDDTLVFDVVGPHAVGIRIVSLAKAVRKDDQDPTPGWFRD
jgi:hypothetical protein